MNFIEELNQLTLPPLLPGYHQSPEDGLCIMEMVAFIQRLEHTDMPACTCPLIVRVSQCINDMVSDKNRNKLLEYIPYLIDTNVLPPVDPNSGVRHISASFEEVLSKRVASILASSKELSKSIIEVLYELDNHKDISMRMHQEPLYEHSMRVTVLHFYKGMNFPIGMKNGGISIEMPDMYLLDTCIDTIKFEPLKVIESYFEGLCSDLEDIRTEILTGKTRGSLELALSKAGSIYGNILKNASTCKVENWEEMAFSHLEELIEYHVPSRQTAAVDMGRVEELAEL